MKPWDNVARFPISAVLKTSRNCKSILAQGIEVLVFPDDTGSDIYHQCSYHFHHTNSNELSIILQVGSLLLMWFNCWLSCLNTLTYPEAFRVCQEVTSRSYSRHFTQLCSLEKDYGFFRKIIARCGDGSSGEIGLCWLKVIQNRIRSNAIVHTCIYGSVILVQQ